MAEIIRKPSCSDNIREGYLLFTATCALTGAVPELKAQMRSSEAVYRYGQLDHLTQRGLLLW